MTNKPQSKRANPNKDELAQLVLQCMRDGLSTLKACEKVGVHPSSFNRWVAADAELANEYTRAREDLLERMADEVLELSDKEVPETGDGKRDWQAIQQRKLQVDSRKWLLSKLAPKKYGDRLELAGDRENPLQVQALDASKLSTEVLAQIVAAKDATDQG